MDLPFAMILEIAGRENKAPLGIGKFPVFPLS
jgi:hypothetical protein